MTLSLTLVFWLLIAVVVLLVAWLVHLGQRLNREVEQRAGLQTWAGFRDPDYWRERLGREDAPLVNDEPEPDSPPECQGVHPVARDGKTCEACGVVLV